MPSRRVRSISCIALPRASLAEILAMQAQSNSRLHMSIIFACRFRVLVSHTLHLCAVLSLQEPPITFWDAYFEFTRVAGTHCHLSEAAHFPACIAVNVTMLYQSWPEDAVRKSKLPPVEDRGLEYVMETASGFIKSTCLSCPNPNNTHPMYSKR